MEPRQSGGMSIKIALAAAGAAVGTYFLLRLATPLTASDLMVYRDEGAAVRHGQDLYASLLGTTGHSRATYPPFAAVGFVPFSYLPPQLCVLIGLVANLVLLAVAVRLSFRLAGREANRVELAVASGLLLWAEPVFTTFRYGQINLLLLVLVLWDFQPGRRRRGIATGIAAGLKVTPLVFVGYLVLSGRWRAAYRAVLTLASTIGVTAVLLPHDTWRFWTRDLFDVARVGRLENAVNQSVRGLLVRLDHSRATTAGEKLFIAAVAVVGLTVAVRAYRRHGDAWGLPACAITGLLAAPIAWSHHWIWCVPISVLLWVQGRSWVPAVAIFWTYAVWAIPHRDGLELHLTRLQLAASGWYVVFGVGFLALAGHSRLGLPRGTLPPWRRAGDHPSHGPRGVSGGHRGLSGPCPAYER